MKVKFKLLKKQMKAFKILSNFRNGIKLVLFGGAAGGGKTVLGCFWILFMALKFPGTRYLIGRSRLTTMKISTIPSFFWVLNKCGMVEGLHYWYNENKNMLTLFNDSTVLFRDLFTYPSDPDFDKLGGLEITAAFVDEGNQVSKKAMTVLLSRIRFMLKEFCDMCGATTKGAKVLRRDENGEPELFRCRACGCETEGLIPKLLTTCNPAKNWVYNDFYKPFKEGVLAAVRAFIPSTAGDNPKLAKSYLESFDLMDAQTQARLKLGSWEHSDPYAIFKPDPLADLFQTMREVTGERYFLAIDPSGTGKDAAEFMVMSSDMVIVEWTKLEGELKPDDLFAEADRLIDFYNIDQYDISFDADGLGWALKSKYEYAFAIYNGGTALYGEKYKNLKTQLYYRLARLINEGKIALNCWTQEIEDELTQELQIVQRTNIDADGRIEMTSKAKIKEQIGRSPNKSDVFAYMMRHFMEDLDNSYIVF